MYGQMTAGSWIYIGTQGIVQGTYECFAEIARRRFGGSLAGTITLTAGLGGMGGAQPLAVTMNGGVALCVEVDPERIRRRLETRYLDEQADDLDDAVAPLRGGEGASAARSASASAGTPPSVLPELADARLRGRHRHRPDQRPRSARRLRPGRAHARGGRRAARARPGRVRPPRRARRWRRTASRWSASWTRAPRCSTTATACAPRPSSAASSAPSPTPASSPPTSGRCSARARARSGGSALSGDPADIAATDRAVLDEFPDDEALARWIRHGGRADRVPGPAGADLLARLRRAAPARAAVQRDGRAPASCTRRS